MVAYNFKAQFAPLVEAGQKTQTIRALGKRRHARPGDALQLYTGMRTKGCRKLLETTCVSAFDVDMNITDEEGLTVFVDGIDYDIPDMIALAEADGFGHERDDPLDEFIEFFEARMPFQGVLIKWRPLRL
ncbi:MAG: hypothetical protein ACFB0G_11365 [Leptolyngbyaceae cyanobacterium]